MAGPATRLDDRHEATRHLMTTLSPNPRLDGVALDVAMDTWDLAVRMCHLLADGPELTAGLRLLRQAKDCFVLQGLADSGLLPRAPGPPAAPGS